eukprot:CFRG1329T1
MEPLEQQVLQRSRTTQWLGEEKKLSAQKQRLDRIDLVIHNLLERIYRIDQQMAQGQRLKKEISQPKALHRLTNEKQRLENRLQQHEDKRHQLEAEMRQ